MDARPTERALGYVDRAEELMESWYTNDGDVLGRIQMQFHVNLTMAILEELAAFRTAQFIQNESYG